jgi:hypothetical protein
VKGFGYDSQFEIPAQVEILGPYSLSGLRTVSRVVIPGGVRQLNECVFVGTGIRVISLPKTISADPRGFEGIQAVTWVESPEANTPQFTVRDVIGYAGHARSILCDLSRGSIIRCFARARVIIVPRDVVRIGHWAFSGVDTLRHLECEVASKLETIGVEAFHRSGLVSITLPGLIRHVATNAIPLSCTVELEAGLVTREAEDEFDRWLGLRDAGFTGAFFLN